MEIFDLVTVRKNYFAVTHTYPKLVFQYFQTNILSKIHIILCLVIAQNVNCW